MVSPNNPALLAAHPIELYASIERLFPGEDWKSWEMETLLHELRDDMDAVAADKLMAVKAVAANPDMPYTHAPAFEKTANAFCNNVCVMDAFQPPYVEELTYAVTQLHALRRLVRPEEDASLAVFSGEVPGYVAATAKYRGWMALPGVLSFGQEFLNALNGVSENSPEREKLMKTIALYTSLTKKDAEDMLRDSSVDSLAKTDEASAIVRDILGALLFDPTLPYGKSGNAGGS
jgi:hypothetical protein